MATLADQLNRDCSCLSIDRPALQALLERGGVHGLYGSILAKQPHLFSSVPVFLSHPHIAATASVITAIERIVHLPAYIASALARVPAVATPDRGPHGVFYGYDFHLGANGPQLIEINTNAGGALLNAILAQAQKACCAELATLVTMPPLRDSLEDAFVAMFRREYALQRGDAPLRRIAIVDDAPETQYLYPEFLLFQQMFRAAGLDAVIVSGDAFALEGAVLRAEGLEIDMIYNRLTDFYFERDAHRTVREAYEAGLVVVTPAPRSHAVYADKRNLVTLSDPDLLRALGADDVTISTLVSHVPRTVEVAAATRDSLWRDRKKYFFKPVAGYGGKAAYRGDKLTTSTWTEMANRDYIAQEVVRPSERTVLVDGERVALKLDVRAYVYDGQIQLMAARLYQGQTTNFRTPGGGFAPVFTDFEPTNPSACCVADTGCRSS